MMEWDTLAERTQRDLLEWYNLHLADVTDEDKSRLTALVEHGQFEAWDCPGCGERCYRGNPDDWGNFQGVRQVDHSSYPGNAEKYTPEYIAKQCDDCRSRGAG